MAIVYTINYTDPSKPSFVIPPHGTNGPSAAGPGVRNTDLDLIGMRTDIWGEKILENFVHLLENFASPEDGGNIGNPDPTLVFSPTQPTEGQLWFNSTNNLMYVYHSTSWNVIGVGVGAGIIASMTPPPTTGLADLWWDTTIYSTNSADFGRNLHALIGGSWVKVAADYMPRDGSKPMTGTLDMAGNAIINLAQPAAPFGPNTPAAPAQAATTQYVHDQFLDISGDAMSGDITFPILTTIGNAPGIRWAGNTDNARIYVETYALLENSRLVFEITDNNEDYMVFRATQNTLPTADIMEIRPTVVNFQQNVDMLGNQIDNIGDPTADTHGMSRLYADNRYVNLTGDTMTGSLVIGSFGTAADRSLRVHADNDYSASIEAYGPGQSDGYLYVGQNSQFGGGLLYRGDGTNSGANLFSGFTQDTITLYGRTGGVNTAQLWFLQNSTTTNLRGDFRTGQAAGVTTSDVYVKRGGVDTPLLPSNDADNLYVNLTGDTMTGELNMGANRIVNLGNPTTGTDAIPLTFADNRYVNITGDTMTGVLSMGNNRISDLANPTSNTDAVPRLYADNRYLNITGDTMSGNINMNNNEIVNVANPISSSSAMSLGFADNRYINVSGDAMTGVLSMSGNIISSLAPASSDDDAVSRIYADNRYLNITGDTMTGELNMGANIITNVPLPVANSDVTNKQYVDSLLANDAVDMVQTLASSVILTQNILAGDIGDLVGVYFWHSDNDVDNTYSTLYAGLTTSDNTYNFARVVNATSSPITLEFSFRILTSDDFHAVRMRRNGVLVPGMFWSGSGISNTIITDTITIGANAADTIILEGTKGSGGGTDFIRLTRIFYNRLVF